MKKQILFSILFLLSFLLSAQNITYNHLVDSTNTETKKVMQLFEGYIKSKPQNQSQNEFWNEEDQKAHKKYDFLEDEFQPSLYMNFPVHVLSIKSKQGVYTIKAQFSFCQDDGIPYVLAVVNYVVQKENGAYRLFNALSTNRSKWECNSIGLVNFYHPSYHQFNIQKAKNVNDYIYEICKNLDVKPRTFEYYLADDYDEIQSLKGIDYYVGMGGEVKATGKASGNKVYCGGLGEEYLHEVFHVQIDVHYPNKHYWVTEGVATYLGGNKSRGKDLQWHFKRTFTYLNEHPEVDLCNLLEYTTLDQYTDFHYVLGGLIAKKIFEKGSWPLLKEFMNSGTSNDDYYAAIKNLLGIDRTDLDAYIRNTLAEEVGQ